MRVVKNLEDISDGKLYDIDDIVQADTGGCKGCNVCCHDIGDLVVLTPFDAYEMTRGVGKSFDELVGVHLELREENKILLPFLKMVDEDLRCNFLSEEGRCMIHQYRPNICRLFPLGRAYQKDSFKYFLQVASCVKPKLDHVKVREWIGIGNYDQNKTFLMDWYHLTKAFTFRMKFVYDEAEKAVLHQILLDAFYRLEIKDGEDFYEAFYRVLPEAKRKLGII